MALSPQPHSCIYLQAARCLPPSLLTTTRRSAVVSTAERLLHGTTYIHSHGLASASTILLRTSYRTVDVSLLSIIPYGYHANLVTTFSCFAWFICFSATLLDAISENRKLLKKHLFLTATSPLSPCLTDTRQHPPPIIPQIYSLYICHFLP